MLRESSRWCTVLGFVGLLVLGSSCNPYQPPDPDDGNSEDDNHRPTVELRVGDEGEDLITIVFGPGDEDGDTMSVTLLYSVDDGNSFSPCTPFSGNENPTEDLKNADYVTFSWDSSMDVGTATVLIRAIANDGIQDGPPETSEPFDVDNGVSRTMGPVEEGNDLNNVGGMLELDVDDEGSAEIELNDGTDSTRNNKSEEFMLIVTNTDESSTGYSLSEIQETAEERRLPQGSSPAVGIGKKVQKQEVTPYRKRVRAWADYVRSHPEEREAAQKSQPATSANVVGQTRKSFYVRSDLQDSGSYVSRTGILAAEGQNVLFFVDEDVPIDWDYDNDGVVDEEDRQGRKTYGFDTGDLTGVAGVFDNNILYHLHKDFGYESDIDGNGYITVFITPILNLMTVDNGEGGDSGGSVEGDDDDTVTAEAEEDSSSGGIVKVYVDPEVDLSPSDSSDNPDSNYQEILFLYAPDPGGIFNPEYGGGGDAAIDEYVTVSMAANMAIATESLISYNYHYLEAGGDPEEDWLNDGLGILAADLSGFGSIIYDDIFYYLDAPYLWQLTSENTINSSNDRGFQYLLLRYLVDTKGVGIISSLIDSEYVGTENIEVALQNEDSEATFDDFLFEFMMAISLGDMTNAETGSALVPDVGTFQPAITIPLGSSSSGATPSPSSSEYEGAEGYQQGINMFGMNYARTRSSDGTFVTKEYRFSGADWSHYAPGIDYTGFVSGGYGTQFTRICGLIDPETTLQFTGGSDALKGLVIRLNNIDPDTPTVVVEKIWGTLADDMIKMEVFEDGTESVALGEMDTSQNAKLLGGTELPVQDTDLYKIDLSSWSKSKAKLLITLDRSITSYEGSAQLSDVLLAVVPLGDLPIPSAQSGTYQCDDAYVTVEYPNKYLQYLYSQFILNPTVGAMEGFDPKGETSEDADTCNFDYVREAKSEEFLNQNDVDEPEPETLVDQILTYQVQYLGETSTIDGFYPYTTSYLDIESTDEDETPLYDFEKGVGGLNVEGGEEGLMLIELPTGKDKANAEDYQYVLVVGAPDGTGPYELTVKVFEDL